MTALVDVPPKWERPLFGRKWELSVSSDTETRTWDGIDLEFEIVKTGTSAPNELKLKVMNLNADSRAFISRRNLNVILKAGYQSGFGQIFRGNIETINHVKGPTDWFSDLYCKDGGAALRTLTISKSFKKDTPITTVINAIINGLTLPPKVQSDLQAINTLAKQEAQLLAFKPKPQPVPKKKRSNQQKAVPPIEQQQRAYLQKREQQQQQATQRKLKRDEVYKGAAVDKLKVLCDQIGLNFSIDDQVIRIWPKDAAADNEVLLLDRTSGMVGSPEPIEGGWKIRSLLRHEFKPGDLLFVDSLTVQGVQLIQRIEYDGSTTGNNWFSTFYTTGYQE